MSTPELLVAEGLTSENTLCINFSMAGTAVGSKEMTDIVYVAGKMRQHPATCKLVKKQLEAWNLAIVKHFSVPP